MEKEKEAPKSTEYPKSLHADGDRNAAHRIVHDEDEERAARAEGFKMIDKARDAAAVTSLGLDTKPEPAVEAKADPKSKKTR